jgi:hypothetical protein
VVLFLKQKQQVVEVNKTPVSLDVGSFGPH